jgi:hypothetical protein
MSDVDEKRTIGSNSRLVLTGVAYCDTFDIMSAMNVHSFQDALNRKSGPTLNAMSRATLGWLQGSRIWSKKNQSWRESVVLAPLNRPELDGYLMAKFVAPSRDPSQTAPSTYTVELKEPFGWDAGFINPHVMIHEIRSDGLVRLLTNFHGGHLDLDPNLEFVAPDASVVVRLLHLNSATDTAEVRVSRLPANGQRSIRIEGINYDGLGLEYVVIQNDTAAASTLTNWTLRDKANHVFTFPSFVLNPGFDVRIWTKSGADDVADLFWGRLAPIWTNTKSTAILRDETGTEISQYTNGGRLRPENLLK